ncbi:DUF362 domain-containing protein [Oceanirhabdus sp. W0125-5]|uniref:DUF362 domain-containing protein n=1 Tax=Oceanirhabdus sp. W0125-5 TaxID=2999116 RepID=UPI0022F3337C|nr:4Fe-4S binding protein [Oceanirhabdus sp. W0125-5]WBW94971.1 4Fe-4S binding protein [Oceanirhabdus sp. W0125-5]
MKGKVPFRKRNQSLPLGPTVCENCTKCGICVDHCPAGALAINDSVQVNHELCIRCNSCVKRCSKKAIDFDERLHHVRQWLEDNCRIERKEPETFFIF